MLFVTCPLPRQAPAPVSAANRLQLLPVRDWPFGLWVPSCQQGDVFSPLMRSSHDRGLTAEGIQEGSPLLGSAPLVQLVLKTIVAWESGSRSFPSEATAALSWFFCFLPSSCTDSGPPTYHVHTQPCFSETQCQTPTFTDTWSHWTVLFFRLDKRYLYTWHVRARAGSR